MYSHLTLGLFTLTTFLNKIFIDLNYLLLANRYSNNLPSSSAFFSNLKAVYYELKERCELNKNKDFILHTLSYLFISL